MLRSLLLYGTRASFINNRPSIIYRSFIIRTFVTPVKTKPKTKKLSKKQIEKQIPTKSAEELATEVSNKPSRQEVRLKALLREKWHIRQLQAKFKEQTKNPTKKQSKNKEFLKIPVQQHLIDYVYKFGLVRAPVERDKKKKKEQDVILEYEFPQDDNDDELGIIPPLEPLALQQVEPKVLFKYEPPKTKIIQAQLKMREFKPNDPRKAKIRPDQLCSECSNWVFGHKMKLVGVAKTYNDLVQIINNDSKGINLPHIAFAGRSNVGKSSLINSITGRSVMKTSDRPGETRTVNFYRVGQCLTVVDLPGYGFAYANEKVKQDWNELMKNYFTTCRDKLKIIYLLLDARHGIKHGDKEMIQFLEQQNVPYQFVLTKTDLVFVDHLARRLTLIEKDFEELTGKKLKNPIILASSETKSGIAYMKDDIVNNHASFIVDFWKKNIKKNVVLYL